MFGYTIAQKRDDENKHQLFIQTNKSLNNKPSQYLKKVTVNPKINNICLSSETFPPPPPLQKAFNNCIITVV